jgi:hypothetical protein
MTKPSYSRIEQLLQLQSVTCDGNLISKQERDHLEKAALICRSHGWQVITPKGIEYLSDLGLLKA